MTQVLPSLFDLGGWREPGLTNFASCRMASSRAEPLLVG